MKSRSAKQKGKTLQNKVVKILREAYPELHDDDITSQISGCNGEDVILSPAAREIIPYSWECKKYKAHAVLRHMDQCISNCPEIAEPVVVIEEDRGQPHVLITLDLFMRLVKNGT